MAVNNTFCLAAVVAVVVVVCCCSLEGSEVVGVSAQKVAGVNLGGWLVIEKWMRPSLWDAIPEPDLLVSLQFCSIRLRIRASSSLFLWCQVSILEPHFMLFGFHNRTWIFMVSSLRRVSSCIAIISLHV